MAKTMKPSDVARKQTLFSSREALLTEQENWYYQIKQPKVNTSLVQIWDKPYLHKGKIYLFDYTQVDLLGLNFYDKSPMLLSLGQLRRRGNQGTLFIGINLNFIPLKLRGDILDFAYELGRPVIEAEENRATQRSIILQSQLDKCVYDNFKNRLVKSGFGFAIRTYYINRMKNVRVIAYSEWYRTLFLQQEKIVGATINQIYADYIKYKQKVSK